MQKRSAAEVIAFHIGWEIGELRDCHYQCTIWRSMAVYACDDDYFCCPPKGRKPLYGKEWPWKPVAEYWGRTVYHCTVDEQTKHLGLD